MVRVGGGDGHIHGRGAERTVQTEAGLFAVGRRPATDGFGLEVAGVDLGADGAVVVDEHLRTTVQGVDAVGVAKAGPRFTYVSLDDYRAVVDDVEGVGERTTSDRKAVPYTLFLTPPLARVGLTEQGALGRGLDVRVATRKVADIAAMPRARIEGDPRGIVKVVVDGTTDQVLGAALMRVDSHEVINLVALAMRADVTASELRDGIWTHPSETQALNEVLGAVH